MNHEGHERAPRAKRVGGKCLVAFAVKGFFAGEAPRASVDQRFPMRFSHLGHSHSFRLTMCATATFRPQKGAVFHNILGYTALTVQKILPRRLHLCQGRLRKR
jgi:hypothetical protein